MARIGNLRGRKPLLRCTSDLIRVHIVGLWAARAPFRLRVLRLGSKHSLDGESDEEPLTLPQFEAFDPKVEVNGETVFSIVDGMGAYKETALRILRDNGINAPKPGDWYPQQHWLNAFREIAENVGPNTIHRIGVKIPQNAQFPPHITSLAAALESIDVAYHMNHRGGEIGHYLFEPAHEGCALLRCENPYPCDFDRGIIEAIAGKFRPPGSVIRVEHDDAELCRKKGGRVCVYRVIWQ